MKDWPFTGMVASSKPRQLTERVAFEATPSMVQEPSSPLTAYLFDPVTSTAAPATGLPYWSTTAPPRRWTVWAWPAPALSRSSETTAKKKDTIFFCISVDYWFVR